MNKTVEDFSMSHIEKFESRLDDILNNPHWLREYQFFGRTGYRIPVTVKLSDLERSVVAKRYREVGWKTVDFACTENIRGLNHITEIILIPN